MVYRNKLDENGLIIRNKARGLVAQWYNQEEGIDFEDVVLAFANCMIFKHFQMDIKNAKIDTMDVVYVEQPPPFENEDFPTHVYNLNKVLYRLKQPPRAWYDEHSKFLIDSGFDMGNVDTSLFTKWKSNKIYSCYKIYMK